MLAIAAIAAVDAFRADRDGDEDGGTEAEAAARVEAARALRRAGATGVLVVAGPGCDLRALRLPGLRPARPPEGPDVGCRFALSPDGRRVAPGGAVWHAWSDTYAICRGLAVDVLVPPSGRPTYRYDGCAPAWRSGRAEETLTVARERGIFGVRPACAGQPPCERLLLSSRLLRRAALRHPEAPSDPRLVDGVDVQALVWLDAGRAAVLLRLRLSGPAGRMGPLQLVALVDRHRVRWTRHDVAASDLTLSPRGSFLVAQPNQILRPDGSRFALPRSLARRAQAVAWSPDERWLAVATGATIVLLRFGEGGSPGRAIVVPLAARHLAWSRPATVRP